MKKILVYSHDTFGLGNIRRMLAISEHLVGADPDVSVLIISGSPMLHTFRIAPGIDYVKLPCLQRTRQGNYGVKTLGLAYEQTLRLRAGLILSTVLDFEPDLMLVDKKPCGVGNELEAALEVLQRRPGRPRMVLLLRDILDSSEATTRVWRKNGYHQTVQAYYDQVLVAGSQDIFDLADEYHFPSTTKDRTHFCGYIRRQPGARSREAVRDELQIGDGRLVLLTAGGGEDGECLLSSYLEGQRRWPLAETVKTLMVCGPELSRVGRQRIATVAAACSQVLLKEFTDDMMSYMGAADLVVSMGGYNTICEILTLRKRAIIVPRTEPVQEQWIRAERMAGLGLLRTIHPHRLSPESLIGAVDEELGRENVRPSGLYQVALDGLDCIGDCINELLAGSAQVQTPRLAEGMLP